MRDKNRRWIEWVKDLLIVVLTGSALVLIYFSPLVQGSGLLSRFSQGLADGGGGSPVSQELPAAAIPTRMAIGSSRGLYALQYDQEQVDALFETTAPLLGECLNAAQSPAAITEAQWQALLGGTCLYFDYTCPAPLTTLCAWLKSGGENPLLTASARRLIVAPAGDGTLSLCYLREDGQAYRCATGLDASLHLEPVIESVSPNSAFFAFEDESLPDILDPYTLFTGDEVRAPIYQSAAVSLSDEAVVGRLLTALSFSDQNQALGSDSSIYVDGDDTLRLFTDGVVRYHASGEGRYTAADGLSGAVAAAWFLAEPTLETFSGEGRLYLISALGDEAAGYTVTFGYLLNGSPVYLYDQGWAGQFYIREGAVIDFALYLRSYAATGQQALLLPADKAAAGLTALSDQPRELIVRYRDTGSGTAEPGWVGR